MTGFEGRRRYTPSRGLMVAIALVGALLVPALASAHLERPSYWPDPAPDTSVNPPAGGAVPKARSLASAVTGKGPGKVRVVCRPSSLRLALRSIRSAKNKGFLLRPSQPVVQLSKRKAGKLKAANRKFAKKCKFKSIQSAINASGNNDRIVVMPGIYREKQSRLAPVNDPKCQSLLQQDEDAADAGAPANTPSYEYQATCPNDQNLIYVQGREVKGDPLPRPLGDRHGIPEQELGACVRCNLQIEGSGAKPEDVIMDGGSAYKTSPKIPSSQPTKFGKHVVLRTDRSDGFVGRNFLLRGALEHGFYTEETDGVLLDKVKFYWAADYGHLSFTTDHNVIRNCEGFGAGDAVVYPGASPQTGDFRDTAFYPEQRFSTTVEKCDLHGSTLAYSGSMGNSVRVTNNHIYGNTNGIASDTLSAAGHPGFPADGMKIDNNMIYSNNLNLYTDDPIFAPYVPMPIGTGIVWAGMNDAEFSNNFVFDNWRHGAVLLAVPDEVAGDPDGNVDSQIHCRANDISSTSCDNRFFGNTMGQVPEGFKVHPGLDMFGNQSGLLDAGGPPSRLPNGVDFWWDEFPGNTGNCWYDNIGPDGTTASITGPGMGDAIPAPLPGCAGGTNPTTSVGTGDVVKEAILVDCSMWSRGETADDRPLCYWFQMPERPGTAAARAQDREIEANQLAYAESSDSDALRERLDEIAGDTALTDRP